MFYNGYINRFSMFYRFYRSRLLRYSESLTSGNLPLIINNDTVPAVHLIQSSKEVNPNILRMQQQHINHLSYIKLEALIMNMKARFLALRESNIDTPINIAKNMEKSNKDYYFKRKTSRMLQDNEETIFSNSTSGQLLKQYTNKEISFIITPIIKKIINQLQNKGINPFDLQYNNSIFESLLDEVSQLDTMDIEHILDNNNDLDIINTHHVELMGNLEYYEQQLEYETRALSNAVAKYRKLGQNLAGIGKANRLGPIERLTRIWYNDVVKGIEQLHQEYQINNNDDIRKNIEYQIILTNVPAPELAIITINEVLSNMLSSPHGIRFREVALHVGKDIINEYFLRQERLKLKEIEKIKKKRQKDQKLFNNFEPVINKIRNKERIILKSTKLAIKIGAIVVQILIENAYINISKLSNNKQYLDNDYSLPAELNENIQAINIEKMDQFIGNNSQANNRELFIQKYLNEVQIDQEKDQQQQQEEEEEELLEIDDDDVYPMTNEENDDHQPTKLTQQEFELNQLFSPNKGYNEYFNKEQAENNIIPAFAHFNYYQTSSKGIKRIGILTCHNLILEIIEKNYRQAEILKPRMLPMAVPPKPWTSYNDGGYYFVPNTIMRTQGSHLQREALKYVDLTKIYQSLNYLGSIPWRINNRILDVIEYIWEEEKGGVPFIPTRIDHILPNKPNYTFQENPSGYRLWQRNLAIAEKNNRNLHSLRCSLLLKLQCAKEFSKKVFYFPYSLDFRGRAYPIPPHLNHIGADIDRGLLLFHEKKLGTNGLNWLFIHLANLYGYDKVSLNDRMLWSKNRLNEILATADDPLGLRGNKSTRWWLNADNPWQCLATCFEIADAINSGDPEQYESSIPIHQDGTCNGLQHYAALGLDYRGAISVNLIHIDGEADKPNDVYGEVGAEVIRAVSYDAKHDLNPYAKYLLPHISRKVIKQTVMTSVYGVTLIGAKGQIRNRLKEIDNLEFPKIDNEEIDDDIELHLSKASMYLAKKTISCLDNMFTSAREVMDWLAQCAELLAYEQQPTSWVTPLNLPIIQPYRTHQRYLVQTKLQQVVLTDQNDCLPISGTRQISAFPPNFVHSLDATHMMMTALKCQSLGITYTSVHDSFWTHAGSIEIMNKALRESFVELYNLPILEDFKASLEQRHPDIEFPPVPTKGNLDLSKIMNSKYFFN